ncbi:MAG: lamin tail domain-containing protein [Verrucomicrobia bacterium]|nr:lamin tail domain-containing protein [Verrucomicrobiota bacterium]
MVLSVLLSAGMGRAADTLIPFGSNWKYLDNGSDQGTAWSQPAFNDSSWTNGPAQLGYGDDDEATIVSYGSNPDNKFITTYFRRSVTVENPAAYSGLEWHLLRDDGAVVYLNGQEVFRDSNMPTGTVTYQTQAITGLGTPEEGIVVTNTSSTSLLLAGTNVVAVEIHQATLTSSDLSFDLEVIGLQPNAPPTVSLSCPPADATLTAPATVPFVAAATDTDGAVAKVEFFVDGAKVGEDGADPFLFTWAAVPVGSYVLTAVATDNKGATSLAAPVAITVIAPVVPTTNTLIAMGSVWNYLDDGSDQGTNWTELAFDDSTWKNGAAQLGYGDGDEATVVEDNATPGYVRADTDRYIATYFRHAFVLTNAAEYASLNLSVLFDDGAVVHLNGSEVFRCNMPPGTLLYNTPAILSGVGDNTVWETNLPASLLRTGTNVIAATARQDAPDSSDISFDLRLLGITSGTVPNAAPTVALTTPSDGTTFVSPAAIPLAASASDSDGSIAWVEFRQNDTTLAEDSSSPFEFNWADVPPGAYSLTAVAIDHLGAATTSAPVDVTVYQSALPTTNILVATGSAWTYLDDGTDQGTAWSALGFDDSAWSNGVAPLGYCGTSCSYSIATTVSYGSDSDNKHVTTYFRRAFTVDDPDVVLALTLSLLWDDGAVVYINGQEVHRVNMPDGTITNQTFAVIASNYSMTDTELPAAARAALVPGNNILAVEIHQGGPTSSDIVMDAALRAVISSGTNLAPSVSLTAPADGAVFATPVDLTLEATASDFDGTVAKVEFCQNGAKLGEDTSSPFAYTWSGVPAGLYALTAIATDDLGASTVSEPVDITVNEPGTTTTNTLIAAGSVWNYLDDGSDQGTNWILLGFDDSGWTNGPAELGYGDGDEKTEVSYGPSSSSKYPTTYFRSLFMIEDPAVVVGLTLNVLRDDGAVVYLNGQQVFSLSMPETFDYATYATTADDYDWEDTTVSPAFLVPGTNVIAVEVHQGNGSSSDISFDLELVGVFAPPDNYKPTVSLTSPAASLTVAAPASLTLTANATDRDGTVTNLAFLANGIILAEDAVAPYTHAWADIPAGVYALAAVATDDLGLAATSAVVTLTVSTDTAPPTVAGQSPNAGAVTHVAQAPFQQVTVTFSKTVLGVDAADFLVNGAPATNVSGSGSVYTFGFPQPAYGAVTISWAGGHGITDVFTPPHAFDAAAAGATWEYQLLDGVPPFIASLDPAPGSVVAGLTNVTVAFSEAVSGVNAGDLRINNVAASSVSGSGAGPYTFRFAQPAPGPVAMAWAAWHGIQDSAGNPFGGATWSYELDTNVTGVIISEIMYHPSSENVLEEYIELHNKGAGAVNLTGWRFSDGVEFTFPSVTLPGGGYLVVAADVAAFTAKYPGVTNVIGNWVGLLSNGSEDIDLDDALGQRVDSVRYADEGDWAIRQRGPLDRRHRGWVWYKEHDGLGKSLELVNPLLSNNHGQNWAASAVTNGTPGQANSVLDNNIAPLILQASHSPTVPRSTHEVLITARLVDEVAGSFPVTLHYRASVATPPPFSTLAMSDDGLNGDAAAGDGNYSAVIPAQANNTVIEWYVEAADLEGHTRTWPAPAIAAADGAGPTGQVVNALFQVDDTAYAGTQPLYKIIMTEAERAELRSIPGDSNNQGPNSQMNATFISLDGAGLSRHYLVGVRNRGHYSRAVWPMNYRVNFRSDDPWKNVTGINLNSRYVHIQHFGAVLSRISGADGRDGVAAQVRVNNENHAQSGSPMYGSYAALESYDGGWTDNHYPNDPDGNIYRAVRDITPPDFNYRGTDINSYTNTWYKETNQSENDWSDLLGMLGVVGINNPTPFTTENVRNVINVEQWLRHLAVMNLMGNAETGLNSGYNDDYYTYAGGLDPRFILMYHDLDQILGQGGSMGSTAGIFTATANNGAGQALDRLMHWPDFEPIYYKILKELLETTFAKPQFDALLDQTLGSYVDSGVIASMRTWMDARRTHVLSLLPAITVSNAPVATVTGIPRSPTPLRTATFTVGGDWITHYSYQLNGGKYSAERDVTTPISLSALPNGTNVLAVIGKNASEIWQEESAATVVTWVVNTAWPAVRLNEVLALNETALNHAGTFPDAIELFNEGATAVSLAGMRLTDDPDQPNKFTFPAGTTLAAGAYLVVYANNPDGTAGFHLGFGLSQSGEGVYLFNSLANGGALLDSVAFGHQLADLSIGRLDSGEWHLTQPTFGAANTAQPLGDPRTLKINEWLAAPVNPFPEDFIELYNPETLPVALGGLYLTDLPIGVPFRSLIAPLSFIPPNGFVAFTADGTDGSPDHVAFRLALEQGQIALFAPDGSPIDWVRYESQQPGVARGRCPDGALHQTALVIPTPGAPNACPFTPPPPNLVNLVAYTNVWRYDQSGTDLGTEWRAPTYEDAEWEEGAGLLAFEDEALPEPVNTVLDLGDPQRITYYFRTHFTLPPDLIPSGLQLTHVTDDGLVVYLNGVEVYRWNLSGTVAYDTLASSVGDATYVGPASIPLDELLVGDNVMAVEVHQTTSSSSDIVFGLRLDAVIVTNSPVLAGIHLNELLANNASFEEPDGTRPDWAEIYNPSSNAVDIANMSLTDDPALPRRWVFPSGSLVPAMGFLKVRMDGSAPASSTNTGFGLKAEGGSLYLFYSPAEGGAMASGVTYGLQAADFTVGRVPDGSVNWVLCVPTAGAVNIPASLGNPLNLAINEWLANPVPGEDDWFELYNANAQPVDLSGLHLSDNLLTRTKYQIPPLSFIGAGAYGYTRFWADENTTQGPDHVNFKLSGSGEALAVSDPSGVLINGLTFGLQTEGTSEGRLPDGTGAIVRFPGTATPAHANFMALSDVVINEVLTHSDPPLEDAVELHNLTGDDVDISGWYLSDSQNYLLKYRLPAGSVVPANGFLVFYEVQFNAPDQGDAFSFSSAKGDKVYLSQSLTPGVLTGYRAFAEFGPAENGVSFGRHPTSVGVDFTAMSARTFGADNPASTNEFRQGTGRTNAYPKVGPVVINEIMYHPLATNDVLEYVELHNILGTPVPLYDPAYPENTWRMREGIDFNFPPNTIIPAGGFVVLVNFDPTHDPVSRAAFEAEYGNGMTLVGPYSGSLDNAGEAIALRKPDEPVLTPGPDYGLVPYVVVDRVVYDDAAPWPLTPDGQGDVLARETAVLYGNDPINWIAAAPTPGMANFSGSSNTAPVLAAIGNRSVNEGALLAIGVTASDAEAPPQTLTFSLDAGAPDGAGIDPLTGAFTWIPTETQGPGSYPVTVRVTDSGTPVKSDAETITVTVQEVNVAPVLVPIGDKILDEGTVVTFTARADDQDWPAQTLAFSLDAGAPGGASIDPVTGVFSWATAEANGPGTYTLTVRVTDNGSPARDDFETLTVTVREVNQAPNLAAIGDRTVDEGDSLVFTATAADPDLPPQQLTFTLDPGAPGGASIDPVTGVFSWTPPAGSPASTPITIRVTDNGTPPMTDAETFDVLFVSSLRVVSLAPETGGGYSLTWAAIPGKTYQVSYTTALESGLWTNVGEPVMATEATALTVDPSAGAGHRFYRVEQLD